MIYFVRYDDDARPIETASAESGAAAERLTARGFALTGHAAWRAARAELDAETRLRIAKEDERAREAARRAKARGELPPPVGFTRYVI